MKYTVILGAGPGGLFLAHQLYQKQINNILLIDPRAGEYVRPGHVHGEDFDKLIAILGTEEFSKKFGHIKEFERILFEKITSLGIEIQNKRFVRFNEFGDKKSIIISDSNAIEEVIECDYIFDCTGSYRVLLNEINHLISPPPFTIKAIKENIPIKHHFLAYVRMEKEDYKKIPHLKKQMSPSFFTPREHITAIKRMRSFGWTHFNLPQLLAVNFGKNKICMYVECPDDLSFANNEKWLKIILSILTKANTINYDYLPESKKHEDKPRLKPYIVDPYETKETLYTSNSYPTVIPHGDSKIQSHPMLANGICNSMDRIDKFVEHLDVLDGSIVHFNDSEYDLAIQELINKHKQKIYALYKEKEESSYQMLLLAETNCTEVLKETKKREQKKYLEQLLQEIKARIAYHKALILRDSLLIDSTTNNLESSQYPLHHIISVFSELTELLIYAYDNIPSNFLLEKETALKMMEQNAADLKQSGEWCIKKQEHVNALKAYKSALKIYLHSSMTSSTKEATTSLQWHIMHIYCKLDRLTQAISLGITVLKDTPKTPDFAEIRRKFLFNVLKSLQITIQTQPTKNAQTVNQKKLKARMLLDEHPNLLQTASYIDFCSFFDKPLDLESIIPDDSISVQTINNPHGFLSTSPQISLDYQIELIPANKISVIS